MQKNRSKEISEKAINSKDEQVVEKMKDGLFSEKSIM